MTSQYKISVLLPSRERVAGLETSIKSLLNTAKHPENIEFLFGVDDDDADTQSWFENSAPAMFNSHGSGYTAYLYPRLGYDRLNQYVNSLATKAKGDWLLMWNDDAIMDTQDWDDIIQQYAGNFAVLRAETNHLHPYAIFPIIPRTWVDITGSFSPHQLNDAWVSQVGYLLDIVIDIPVHITHDRYDLTGNNNDTIYRTRVMYEGDPRQPHDFNHSTWRDRRMNEARSIASYLENQGVNMEHWHQVINGQIDPWVKMLSKDVKKQMVSYNAQQLSSMGA